MSKEDPSNDERGEGERPPADNTARKAILARRQFFIASAVAGVALSGCDKKPSVCLNVVSPEPVDPPPDPATSHPAPEPAMTASGTAPTASASTPAPQVCLEFAPPDPEPDPKPEPRVCLKIKPPPPPPPPKQKPRVCLLMIPTDEVEDG